MKKVLLLTVAVLTSLLGATARIIPANEALPKAVSVMNAGAASVRGEAGAVRQYTLHLTEKAGATPIYYVFASENGGFLLAGADDRACALLGYTDNGSYEDALGNPAFCEWLSDCQQALTWLSKQPETASAPRIAKPDMIIEGADGKPALLVQGNAPKALTLPSSVSPLVGDILFDQDAPFNGACPEYTPGTKSAVGCAATAAAIICRYYEWPATGEGSNSYAWQDTELSVDFSKESFDYSKIRKSYKGGYSQEEAAEVAKLSYDLGVGMNMRYGASSGAYDGPIMKAFTQFFRYNKGVIYKARDFYNSDEWNEMLKAELAQGAPIYMTAVNTAKNSGHAFIIDGYDNQGLYHLNWGWSGMSNGYFSIDYLNPNQAGIGGDVGGYNGQQSIYYGLRPDKTGKSQGVTELVLSTPIILEEEDQALTASVTNHGNGTFNGKIGFAAIIDGKVVGYNVVDVTLDGFQKVIRLSLSDFFENLGLEEEMLDGGKQCLIYPVVQVGDELRTFRRQVPAYDCMILFKDEEGQLSYDYNYGSMPDIVGSLTLKNTPYEGFTARFDADVTSLAGEFNRALYLYVQGEGSNKLFPTGIILQEGTSKTVEFDATGLKAGSYTANLGWDGCDGYMYSVIDEKTQQAVKIRFTVGAKPKPAVLTYRRYTFFDKEVEQGQEVTASFEVRNTGGYTEKDLRLYFFDGVTGLSVAHLDNLADIPYTGSMKYSKIEFKGAVNLEPGEYIAQFYDLTDRAFLPTTTGNVNSFNFTVSYPTAVDMLEAETAGEADAPMYDLTGRKLAKPVPGRIYIQNGKPMVK